MFAKRAWVNKNQHSDRDQYLSRIFQCTDNLLRFVQTLMLDYLQHIQ
jgi:hypothetical protein